MRVVAILSWGVLALGIAGCTLEKAGKRATERPSVHVRPAAPLRFRGVNSFSADKPGECDSNSPAHWDGDTLYVFNSAGQPWRSAGTNVAHLDRDYVKCEYDTQADGGRWIECTWKSDGKLYGWYHLEPNGVCTASHPNSPHLTAPKIGAVSSSDNGAHWHDLGIVLESLSNVRCDTTNYYFAGGNGDFSVMLDKGEEFLYFFLSSYPPETAEQGVAVARMAWKDRDAPIGKVRKWHSGQWSEPGLGGHVTPIVSVGKDWHRADVDAFWGPSIHWNSYLRQYVMLLNRATDSRWRQEGIYVSFNPDLSHPEQWSSPHKIMEPVGPEQWYPQVVGTDSHQHETDKSAGRVTRLFIRGESKWELVFE